MKTTIVYLALALIISVTSIQAQEIKDGFKIEKTEFGEKLALFGVASWLRRLNYASRLYMLFSSTGACFQPRVV